MTQKKTKTELTSAQKVSIGLGLTTAALTAAGAYFLYGSKQSSQNRKKVKGWVLKAKGEVLEALEKAEAITEEEYKALVEAASGAYGTAVKASAGELKDFKKEMGEHWTKLQKNNGVKKIVKNAKVIAKNVAHKVVAKTTAKKVAPKKAPAKKSVSKK